MRTRRNNVSRALFDVNVPRAASRFLPRRDVDFADLRGWRELTNGDLLTMAESEGFDVLVTADTNLRYQQNLAIRGVSLVVMLTNAWPAIRDNRDPVVRAVDAAIPESYLEIRFARPPRRRRPGPPREK